MSRSEVIGLLAAVLVSQACDCGSIAYQAEAPRREQAARSALSEIRMRQEAYRSEFGQYASSPNWWPTEAPEPTAEVAWGAPPAFQNLGFAPDQPRVPFQLQLITGTPDVEPPWGRPPPDPDSLGLGDFWYVARARGHFESADSLTVLEVTSESDEVRAVGE